MEIIMQPRRSNQVQGAVPTSLMITVALSGTIA